MTGTMTTGDGGAQPTQTDHMGPLAWLLGSCSAISFTAAAVVAFWPRLYEPQAYAEPIVGFMTWYDGDKNQDIRAIYLFLGLCLALMIAFHLGLAWVRNNVRIEVLRDLISLGWFTSLPVMGWFGASLLQERRPEIPWTFMMIWVVGWAWIATLAWRSRSDPLAGLFRLGVSGMASGGLVFLGTIGLLMPIGRLGWIEGGMAQWLPTVTTIAMLAWLLVSAWSGTALAKLQDQVRQVAAGAGILLPMLWFALLPPLMEESGPLNGDRTVRVFAVVIMLWVLSTAGSLWWIFRENRRPLGADDRFWHGFFQPTSLASLAAFIGRTEYTVAQLPPDHWHDGEAMLPWHQLWNFGSIPFVDFNCALGLNSVLRGAANQFLWNGWIGTFIHTNTVIFTFGAAVLSLAAWYCSGPLAAVVVSLLCAPTLDRYQLVVPLILILISPALLKKRRLWISCWLLGSMAAVLFNPSTGIAMGLASLPVALWMIGRAWAEERPLLLKWSIGWVVGLAVILLATPVGRMMLGLYRFVLENQSGYLQQAGLPLSDTWHRMDPSVNTVSVSGFYDLLVYGWVPFAAIVAALGVSDLAKPASQRRYSLIVACWIPVVWLLILSKWTTVRLEFNGMARSGLASYIALILILPALLFAVQRPRSFKLVGVCAVFAIACLFHLSPLAAEADLVSIAFGRREIPPNRVLLTPEQHALTGGGYCLAIPMEVSLLNKLINLRSKFPRDDSLFAFTNRNVMYIYLNQKVPSQYSATYYLATDQMQRHVISDLTENHTHLVLLSPCWTSGEGPISLRSMRIGRWVMAHYRPFGISGNCLGVWDDHDLSEAQRQGAAGIFEKEWIEDDFSFVHGDLKLIPEAWGRSLTQITSGLDLHSDLGGQIVEASNPVAKAFEPVPGPAIYIDLTHLARPAHEADYLSLDLLLSSTEFKPFTSVRLEWLDSNGHTPPEASWIVTHEHAQAIGPDVVATPLLVPLAYRPLWVMGARPTVLRISLINAPEIKKMGLKDAAFWSLKP